MGSEISSFVIEPLLGSLAAGLAISAALEEKKHTHSTKARWMAIGAVSFVIILAIINLILTLTTG